MAKEGLKCIHETVVAYFSPFFAAISSASLLWYLFHSSPIPSVVVKTYGVNVPCSMFISLRIQSLHVVFVLLVFLLEFQVSIRISVGVTYPYIEER